MQTSDAAGPGREPEVGGPRPGTSLEANPSDATPGVDPEETAFRLAAGRLTVDIVPTDHGIEALVGAGVGSEPVRVEVPIGIVPQLLVAADRLDERTAWETGWWPTTI